MDRAGNEPMPDAVPMRRSGEGGWGRFLSAVRTHQGIAVGAVIVAFVVLVAALAPVISPYDPNEIHPIDRLKGIGTPGYLLGTDIQGRDMLSRLAWGSGPLSRSRSFRLGSRGSSGCSSARSRPTEAGSRRP